MCSLSDRGVCGTKKNSDEFINLNAQLSIQIRKSVQDLLESPNPLPDLPSSLSKSFARSNEVYTPKTPNSREGPRTCDSFTSNTSVRSEAGLTTMTFSSLPQYEKILPLASQVQLKWRRSSIILGTNG